MTKALALALALSLTPQLAFAAAPVVPATMTYQGVLLDAGGQPQTGNVDLTFRIFDALSAGTLLYKQSLTNVPLDAGVFAVKLGPTGQATDAPADPLTTSFEGAVAGDLAATGTARFLEVTVGAAGALPRTQILTVPYALEAAHAQTATQADTADVANEALAVNGVPAEAISQVFQHFAFDGSGPPNDDPLEGFGDVDGDGIANFVDNDNDGDGITDGQEVTAGSGVNLLTPTVSEIQPASPLWSEPLLAVTGRAFEAAMTVELGGEVLAAQGITETSFELPLPQVHPKGQATLLVTRLNGETGTRSLTFTSDQIHSLSAALPSHRLTLDAIGAQQVIAGVNNGSDRAFFDSDGDGLLDTGLGQANNIAEAVAWTPGAERALLVDTSFEGVAIFIDANGDNAFQANESVQLHGTGSVSAATLAFRPAGNALAAYFYFNGFSFATVVSHDRNDDGDFADASEIAILDTADPGPLPIADMDVDAAGHVAFVFFKSGTGTLRLARDRNADGDYGDTLSGNPETATLVTDLGTRCAGVAYDDGGSLAVVYGTASAPPTLARDLDGDGDFTSAGESVPLGAEPAIACDVAGGGAPGLSVLVETAAGLHLYVDHDDDGDFDGVREAALIGLPSATPYTPLAVTRSDTGRTIAATRDDLFLDVAP